MQIFEVLLTITCLLFLTFQNKKINPTISNCYLISCFLVLILHSIIEGLRWQMALIYVASVFITLLHLIRSSHYSLNRLQKFIAFFVIILFIGAGSFLSTILPIFELPEPTGYHCIGSQNILIRTDLDELITEQQNDKREFVVKVWYPASLKNEPREEYSNKGERQGFAIKYGLPKHTFSYLRKVNTHTYLSPQIAEGKYPILIFSHGYQSNATEYYALIEEIVSHGYVVFNINHTYESTASLFPSGQIKYYSQEYNDKKNNKEMREMIWRVHQKFDEAMDNQEKSSAIKTGINSYFAAEITDRWAKDIDELIKQIPNCEATTFLNGHLDESKIGVFGHSQGGAAAGQSIINTKKIVAGINIDGVQWGNTIDTFYAKPFLYLSSDWPDDHPDFNNFIYQSKSGVDFFKSKLLNSGHSNFQDIPFIINSQLINQAGSIQKEKAIKITSDLIIQFFNTYLKDENTELLELNSKYDDLIIEKF